MASYDAAALFGDAEAPAAAPSGFDVAFDDFMAAFEAGDTEAARIAFKDAVRACYAEEQPEEIPLGV